MSSSRLWTAAPLPSMARNDLLVIEIFSIDDDPSAYGLLVHLLDSYVRRLDPAAAMDGLGDLDQRGPGDRLVDVQGDAGGCSAARAFKVFPCSGPRLASLARCRAWLERLEGRVELRLALQFRLDVEQAVILGQAFAPAGCARFELPPAHGDGEVGDEAVDRLAGAV